MIGVTLEPNDLLHPWREYLCEFERDDRAMTDAIESDRVNAFVQGIYDYEAWGSEGEQPPRALTWHTAGMCLAKAGRSVAFDALAALQGAVRRKAS